MKFSVVVTAYDHHPVTVVHIRECIRNTRMPDEIIVVNDHGDPNLKELLIEMLEKEEKRPPVTYAWIEEDIEWNYTGARNLGFTLTTGDMLSLEDNDNIPTRTLYEDGLKYFEDNSEVEYILYGNRMRIPMEDVLNKPVEDWKSVKDIQYHRDTKMFKRDVYLKLKGADERFAGRYAWQCADWRRRLNRAEIVQGQIGTNMYYVEGGDTVSLVRRKSYKNYGMAREADGHTQSKAPWLNFNYTFTRL